MGSRICLSVGREATARSPCGAMKNLWDFDLVRDVGLFIFCECRAGFEWEYADQAMVLDQLGGCCERQ